MSLSPSLFGLLEAIEADDVAVDRDPSSPILPHLPGKAMGVCSAHLLALPNLQWLGTWPSDGAVLLALLGATLLSDRAVFWNILGSALFHHKNSLALHAG